jgi:YesN/AraC family two-component response regulator
MPGQAIQQGVSDYIQKPVDEKELEAALARVIASLDNESDAMLPVASQFASEEACRGREIRRESVSPHQSAL